MGQKPLTIIMEHKIPSSELCKMTCIQLDKNEKKPVKGLH
jgi:hypothetical protein